MKKNEHTPQKFKSLSDAFSASGLLAPQHPLIALINGIDKPLNMQLPMHRHVLNFYKISYRPYLGGTLKYGQTYFDFNDGGMLFVAPNQIIGSNEEENSAVEKECINQQITLLIHPDFLLNYALAKKIKQYNYFSYAANEALHLSDKEKEVIMSIFRIIEDELNSRIDEFSQDVIISQIELLLNYANRFYKRQFITRKSVNSTLLQKLEEILDDYFNNEKSLLQGLPTVLFLAEQLNLSPGYLSDMLRSLTGQNTQQHIHEKLIEKAKEKLSTTNLSVSEIAYDLGFEHPQSFSKLFKSKTNLSPLEFRRSFN
jgi:AraC-like DNA-binding protein